MPTRSRRQYRTRVKHPTRKLYFSTSGANDDSPESVSTVVLTPSQILETGTAARQLWIKRLVCKMLLAGVTASGNVLVRMIAAWFFTDADTASSFGYDFDLTAGNDQRTVEAWGRKDLGLALNTTSGGTATAQQVASLRWSGRPARPYRMWRPSESLVLASQATQFGGGALAAGTTVTWQLDGYLEVSP